MEFRASFLLRRSMDNYSNEMQFSHSFDHKIGTGKNTVRSMLYYYYYYLEFSLYLTQRETSLFAPFT